MEDMSWKTIIILGLIVLICLVSAVVIAEC